MRRPQLDRRPADSGRRAPGRCARGRVGCGASEAQILIPIDQSEELGCGREPLGETVNERTWARLITPVKASRTASAASHRVASRNELEIVTI